MASLPLSQSLSDKRENEQAQETTPGDEQWTRWQVVAIVNGLTVAEIVRGRLQAEGIPARTQQDSGGGVLAVTIGILGQAKVLVPEPLAEQALEILESE